MVATPQELARLLGATPIPNTSLSTFGASPLLQQGRPQAGAAPWEQSPAWQAQVAAAKARGATPQSQGGGGRSLLGTVLGGAGTILKPLDLLQTGGRAVTTGVEHLARAIPDSIEPFVGGALTQMVDEQKSRADKRSVMDRIKGKGGYGYGQIAMSTGNKWADRAVGLTGDVVLDPLTWLTFGETAAAGKAGREGLAAKALLEGGSEDLVARAGKGAAYLTDAERGMLGLDRAGIRFAGARIPGTGELANTVGKANSTVRRFVTRPFQYFNRGDEGLAAASRVLASGIPEHGLTPKTAAAVIAWDNVFRTESKALAKAGEREGLQILKGMNAERMAEVVKATERGDYTELTPFFEGLLKRAQEAGVDVKARANFVPHLWTKEARDFLKDEPIRSKDGTIVIDLTKESGATLERKIVGGKTYTFRGKEIALKDGTIEEINSKLAQAFPEAKIGKWMEDDARHLVSAYVNNIATDVGEIKSWKHLLDSKAGVMGALDDVSSEVLDRVKSITANGEARKALEKTLAIREAAYKAEQATAKQTATQLQTELVRSAAESVRGLGEISDRVAAHLTQLADRGKGLDEAAADIVRNVADYRAEKMQDIYRLQGELDQLDGKIQALKIEVASASTTEARNAAYSRFVQERTQLQRQLLEAQKAAEQSVEASNRIAQLYERAQVLRENADNPDFVRAEAQKMVERRQVTKYLPDGMEGGGNARTVYAEQRLMKAQQALDDWSAELMGAKEGVDATLSQSLESANKKIISIKESEQQATAELDALAKKVNQQRLERVGAQWLAPASAATRADVAKGAGKAYWRADLDAKLAARAKVLEAAGVRKDAERELVDAVDEFQRLKKIADTATSERRGTIGEIRDRTDKFVADRIGERKLVAMNDLSPKTRAAMVEQLRQRAAQDEGHIYELMVQLQDSEKLLGELAQAGGAGGEAKRIQGLAEKVAQAEQTHERLLAQLDGVVGELPEAEQAYFKKLQELTQLRKTRQEFEDASRKIEREMSRASRFGTIEAEGRAKAMVVDYWSKRRNLAGLQDAGMRQKMRAVAVEEPIYDMPLRTEIEARLAGLPPSKAAEIPDKSALLKAAKRRNETMIASDVTDDMLANIPPAEAQAFRDLRAQVDEMTQRTATSTQIEKERLQRLIAANNEKIAALNESAGANVMVNGKPILTRETQLQIEESGNLAIINQRLQAKINSLPDYEPLAHGAFRRAELTQLEDRLDLMTDYIARWNNVRQVGGDAVETPEMATRVAREVVNSRYNAVEKRIGSMEKNVTEQDAFSVLEDKLNRAIGPMEHLVEREQALQNELRKIGGAGRASQVKEDFAAAVRREEAGRTQAAVAHAPAELHADPTLASNAVVASPLQRRLELGAMIADTHDSIRLEQELLRHHLGDVLGTNDPDTLNEIIKTLRVKGRGAEKRAAYIEEVVRPYMRRMYDSMPEEARQRLLAEGRKEIDAAQRELMALGAVRQRLGLNRGDVTHDWRQVLFGTGLEGSVPAERSLLESQLALTDKAQRRLTAGSKVNLSVAHATTRERDALDAVAATIPETEARLAGLPRSAEQAAALPSAAPKEALAMTEAKRASTQTQLDRALDGMKWSGDVKRQQLESIDSTRAAVKWQEQLAAGEGAKLDAETKRLVKVGKDAAKVSAAKGDLNKTFDQLDALVKQLPEDPSLAPVVALQRSYAEQLLKVQKAGDQLGDTEYLLKLAKAGEKEGTKPEDMLHRVFERQVTDGFERVAKNLLPEDQFMAVQAPVAAALRNVIEQSRSGDLWKAIDNMTRFFKTYATATPGFHVRNAMSAAFMNASQGVSLKTSRDAFKAWTEYMKAEHPLQHLDELAKKDPQLADAFKAVFGSGAGGGFEKEELVGDLNGKLLHNRWVKWSRSAGENVEGPVRLALALHTTRNGGDVARALSEVTRVHFDYSQVSKFDRKIKAFIPFWTFMSRNLPLQVQQMWMRPRMYSAWAHVVKNMGAGNEFDNVPSWLAGRQAIPLGGDSQGNEWMFAPDLQHLALGEDFATMDPRDPLKALSNLNPMMIAPLEALDGKRWRFNAPLNTPGERLNHMATQMLPPYAMAQRLLGMGRYSGQADEKQMNWLGLPFQKVTPQERANEAKAKARRGG